MTVVYRRNVSNDDLWQRIETANKSIDTIDIKGKNYAQVNQRVKAFRYVYPSGRIQTETQISGDLGKRSCLCIATIYDDLGNYLSDGIAEEMENSTFINKTSFIENAQTSAVGRALGFAGFGIDISIASAEEVETAIANQDFKKPTNRKIYYMELLYNEAELQDIFNHYSVKSLDEMPRDIVDKYIKDRKDKLSEAMQKDFEQAKQPKLDVNSEENPFY